MPRTAFVSLRVWLGDTFHGVTWKRFGIFCLCLGFIVLTRPWFQVLPGGVVKLNWGRLPGTSLIVFLVYTPVFFAVAAAANRGAKNGWRRIASFGIAIVGGLAIGLALTTLVLPHVLPPDNWFTRTIDPAAPPFVRLVRTIGVAMSNLALCVTAVALLCLVKRDVEAAAALHSEKETRERVGRESAEARLLLAQAQIEPHFLFNSLASIRSLYETDREAGRSMLQHLTRYLSASLPILRATRSSLGRELSMATAYLAVQEIRMGTRLTVEIDVPASLRAAEVPPMMLATLVENAVIHGVAPLPAGGRIRIAAREEANHLAVEVDDTGRGLHDTWGAGVGLSNIRARLASEFGTHASLSLVGKAEGGVRATLRLPRSIQAMEAAA